ncbi:MAG TPA: tetratricopeptide repeat protein [Terriglobia bacterium]|nr:tetratricopeptide repeat protein [Terriglobia bacterium]
MILLRRLAAVLLFGAALSAPLAAGQRDTADHNNPDRRFQSALAHFNSGQYAAAQQELETLARDLPDSFDVQELLGLAYSAAGQEEKATAPFEQAVRLRPDCGPARNNLATNLARLGKAPLAEKEFRKYLDQVESLLKRAVALDPSLPEAHLQLGNLYSQRRQYAEALRSISRRSVFPPIFPTPTSASVRPTITSERRIWQIRNSSFTSSCTSSIWRKSTSSGQRSNSSSTR